MSSELQPLITLDDFRQPPLPEQRDPWTEPRTYHADIESAGVKAHIRFRFRAGEHQSSQPERWREPPGYVMDRSTRRADERFGMMGRKQEEHANALFPILEAEMHAALSTAGWRVIGTSRFNGDIWHPYGPTIVEHEARLHALAHNVWHGAYTWQEAEKVAPLDDDLLLRVFPANRWQTCGKEIEAAVDPDARLLRVRRQRRTGTIQEQQRAAAHQSVAVIGNEEAKARGAVPAFHRQRTTREITFACAWCTQTVTQHRYPSPKPMYCSETCEQEAQREKTRMRVQRLRQKRHPLHDSTKEERRSVSDRSSSPKRERDGA